MKLYMYMLMPLMLAFFAVFSFPVFAIELVKENERTEHRYRKMDDNATSMKGRPELYLRTFMATVSDTEDCLEWRIESAFSGPGYSGTIHVEKPETMLSKPDLAYGSEISTAFIFKSNCPNDVMVSVSTAERHAFGIDTGSSLVIIPGVLSCTITGRDLSDQSDFSVELADAEC